MRPILFEVFGLPIHSYGVSKAAAALVAGYLLVREFRRLGWEPDPAWTIVVTATVVGFAGGKLYFLAEHVGNLSAHSFGPSGFTWYGGLIAGVAAVVVMARRYRLPLAQLAGVAVAPLSVAYGIGRIGCFLAGDGSYGQPSDLPWVTAFPNGMVPHRGAGASGGAVRSRHRARRGRAAVGAANPAVAADCRQVVRGAQRCSAVPGGGDPDRPRGAGRVDAAAAVVGAADSRRRGPAGDHLTAGLTPAPAAG